MEGLHLGQSFEADQALGISQSMASDYAEATRSHPLMKKLQR